MGLTGRAVTVDFAHGSLFVEWRADGHVLLSGPVSVSFTGATTAMAHRAARPPGGTTAPAR